MDTDSIYRVTIAFYTARNFINNINDRVGYCVSVSPGIQVSSHAAHSGIGIGLWHSDHTEQDNRGKEGT
ncbi:hypothetical protein [Desulfonatronovibrio magnus]|uniref:hypothetical protein n=1 Tax=Desulfonatronovibrio magnus TaxID=698827 RepID=UPI0012FAC930|nr:hypothetical protein [Desulfonatronovibrio magnus]